jgi:hypothetical protein
VLVQHYYILKFQKEKKRMKEDRGNIYVKINVKAKIKAEVNIKRMIYFKGLGALWNNIFHRHTSEISNSTPFSCQPQAGGC